MKELFVVESSFNPIAASTNRLFAFGQELVKRGVKVHFFYLIPNKNKEKSEKYTEIFSFHYLWEDSIFKNKYICTIISLIKLRRKMRPDIPVYVYALLNCLFFLVGKNGVRVFHEYTEHPNAVGKIHGLVGNVLFIFYGKAIRQISGLFVITPSLKKYYINEFGIDEQKVETLNMVVDPHRFDNLDGVLIQNWITYCGIISEAKDGISYLLKAYSIVRKEYPQFKLVIIGPFENEKTEDDVKCLINENALSEDVVLMGRVPSSRMPELLSQSKILALARPKQKQEAFGFATKIGEYLMTNRPVVMTDVGNVSDYLVDKEDVILARPNDECDLAEKLMWVIEHYDEATIIGNKGKQTALRFFNSEIEVDKIYKRIFSQNYER
ncbi:MAG: glycosyltransferase family 4 protein [Bacteroidales bacterium]|nr:glycosyltransferase family 4 protein [Bacteroidales bacterium]